MTSEEQKVSVELWYEMVDVNTQHSRSYSLLVYCYTPIYRSAPKNYIPYEQIAEGIQKEMAHV